MADANPSPTKIRLERPARRLLIEWSDGAVTSFPWAYLRAHCPSAGERIARQESSVQSNPLAILGKVPSSDVKDLRVVGNYALAFTWGDGHEAGIYTWTHLRELAADSTVEKTTTQGAANE